jgi:hypothetical protein
VGKSSAPKQQVTEYMMSVLIGVSQSLDAITGVFVNEKEAWSGRSSTQEDLRIDQPELFGGVKKEGGLSGYICHQPGAPDQVIPANLTARWGLTPETSPAFRGLTTLFFVGGGAVASGATDYGIFGGAVETVTLAEQNASGGGFSWSYNNPVIAQTVWVRGERAPGHGPGSQEILDPDLAMIGPDANPAHIVAECLTNTSWGMGAPASTINVTKFNAAAQTLFDEAFGLSMKWTRSTEIETFINEILDHIQATMFLNPRSGQWELKLFRDDYDVGTLRTISPDNAKLTNFQRRLWGEAGNQVAVTFTDAVTEEDATITAEDLGAINSQGGSPVTIPRNYYGIRNAALAFRVAQRDVRTAAAPLATASAEVDRSFWDVLPGDPLLLNWPEKNIHNVVVRVMPVDKGTPASGVMKLALLEDIFSLERPPATDPQAGGWVDPGTPPEPIDAVEIITLPAYFTLSADLQTAAVDLEFPEVLAAVMAYSESPDVRAYGLYAEEPTPAGGTVFKSHGSKSIVERTVLPSALAWATESRFDDGLVLNRARGPRVGGFMFFGAGSDAAMEIAQVTAFDTDTREWIISRGVLDTIPRAWGAGTPVWFVNPGSNIVDETALHADGETVEFKILPRTSKGVLPIADADIVAETLTARPHLPLRPGNVKLNGAAIGPVTGGSLTDLTVTWGTRNRTLEDGQVVAWTAGTVAPEYEQGTVVSVYDQTSALVYEQWGLWTEQTLVLQRSWFDRYSAITIQVSSRRRDLDSLQSYRFSVTGLAANPAAPLPPTPAVPGPPPSPDAAPAVGAWAATGSEFTLDSAGHVLSSIPAILVSGVRDRPTAVGLVVRYTKTSPAPIDWFYLPELALDDQPKQVGTTAVAALTAYTVQVAYRSASNILSEWRSLGNVTTGQSVAGNVTMVGGKTAAEAVGAIEAIAELGDGSIDRARKRLAELRSGSTDLAISVFHAAADLAARRDYTDARTLIDGGWVGTYVKQRTEQLFSETEALATETDTLAVAIADANASILDAKTVAANADEALATLITAAQTQIDDNFADFLSEVTLTTTRFASEASARTALATTVGAVSAAVGTESSARSTADSALASSISSVSASVGGLSGSISTVASALATLDAGVDLMWGLALDTGGHVVGISAGITGGVGSLLFVSDQFGFVDPSGANPKFIISYSGSALHLANCVVDGNLLVNGTITGNKIVGGAVSNVEAFENTSLATLSIGGQTNHLGFSYVSDGGKHSVDVYCETGTTTSGAAGSILRLFCDAVLVGGAAIYCPGAWGGTGLSFPVLHQPGAGSRNYAVTYEGTPGSGPQRANRTLARVMELKK